MTTRFLRHIVLLLTVGLASCGFLKEDLDDCPDPIPTPGEVTYRVYFTLAGGDASDIDPADVKELSLYVFDPAGYFVSVHTDASPELAREDYYLELTLGTEDHYRFVAWGNASPNYGYLLDMLPDNSLEEWAVRMDATGCEHLLHGSLTLEPTTFSNQNVVTHVIELGQNSHTVHLTTEGIPNSEEEYTLEMTGEHEGYSFLNKPLPCTPIIYSTLCEKDPYGRPYASSRIYELNANSNTTLSFYNTSQNDKLYEENLISLIQEANRQGASIDFYLTHHFYIHLVFDWTNMEVSVSLNGWNVTNEFHEL